MMRTWFVGCAAAAALAALAVTFSRSGAEPNKDKDKDISIKDIMTKAHKGADSLIGKLDKELKDTEPDWGPIQKQTKELVDLGTALSKATPPKGDKESWEKLTKAYVDNAREMDAAAQKKDRDVTAARLKTTTTMCGKCHPLHKGA
jgi:hypothetical protein